MASDRAIDLLERIAVAVEALVARGARRADKAPALTDDQVGAFLAAWNANRGPLPEAKAAAAGTPRRARIASVLRAEPDILAWVGAVRALAASTHHRGGNERGWVADIDFLLQPAQYQKWLDHGASRPTAARPEAVRPVTVFCSECGSNPALYGPGSRNADMSARAVCAGCWKAGAR